jgi:hypothetical protein
MKGHQTTSIFVCHDYPMRYALFVEELRFHLETNQPLGWFHWVGSRILSVEAKDRQVHARSL